MLETSSEKISINGFNRQAEYLEKYHPSKVGFCFPPKGVTAEEWFSIFIKKIFEAKTNKVYFPVFRLSDGEFIFMLGRKHKYSSLKDYCYNIFGHIKNVLKYQSTFYSSGRPGYVEHYKIWEIIRLRKRFIKSLRLISHHGFLCFNYTNSKSIGLYKDDFNNVLLKSSILLNKNNYSFFYFVYGLLMTDLFDKLIKDQNILLITSNMEERNRKLVNCLYEKGSKNVELLISSLNHPLRYGIELNKIMHVPDIVLIGAGVGSAYILEQLKPLNCLCIDAGYAIDALGDISMAKKRPYMISDNFWDSAFSSHDPIWINS